MDQNPAIYPPTVPTPDHVLSILEVAKAARRNVLELIPQLAFKQPMVSGRTVARWHMVMDPDALERVFKTAVDDYPKSMVTKRILRPAIGDSLFIAEGAHWRWQRRAAAPVFSHRNLVSLSPFMTASAEAAVARIDAQAGGVADLYDEMVTATFDVICDVALSGKGALDRSGVHNSINRYMATVAKVSLLDILNLPTWIPRPAQIFFRGGVDQMQAMMDKVIAERVAKGPTETDLLDLMLAAHDPETDRSMTPEELRDNLLAFVVAGHETTALALAWSLYLCAFDQEVQDKARAEAQAAFGDGPATAEHLPNLQYTKQIIEEAMRLYPPAAFLSRTAQAPDTLGGREIRRGDTVILPIYALHRNRLIWDDPDRFDPDRFAPEAAKARHRYAYLPFGAGPRICIGMGFAVMEAQIILASLLARFRFTLTDAPPPEPVMVLTLRPKGGVKLRVERV
jgi:cytochrome P450